MRILLVNSHGTDLARGGAERYVHDLSNQLQLRGHDVEVLSAFPVADAAPTRIRTLHQVDWREAPTRRYRNHLGDWTAVAWPRFEAVLRNSSPDLLHTSNLPGISTGIWERARRLDIPVVHTLHDYHLLCPRTTLTRPDSTPCRPSPLLCGLRTRRLARWSRAVRVVIGVSEHVVRRHEGFFAPSTKHLVIRAPLLPMDDAAERPPRESLVTLGYLGSLSRAKGVHLLLDAAAEISRHGVLLRIAGDGPLREQVEAADLVRYEGHLGGGARESFLMSCDAGVVPSVWEEPGLTFVVSEWLAAGRPVLATARGGLAEAGARGGVMAVEPSATALADAVAQLRDQLRWQHLLASVPVVEGTADVERWVDEHEAVYAVALSGISHAPTP